MAKITYIGAGSTGFGKRFVSDILLRPALTGDRAKIEQAIALDPLTAAVCTLDQIHHMVTELLEADADFLPQFK